MSPRAKAGALVAAGALAAIALGACGIDYVSNLNPPRSIVGISGFLASDDPGGGYLGVAAAYRIYDTREQALADVERLRQRQEAAGAIPGDAIQTFLLSSNGLRFKPLVIKNSPANPTFSASLVALNSVTFEWKIDRKLIAKINSTEYAMERTSSSFALAPTDGDDDYAKSNNSNNEFILQVIVYSFGIDMINSSLRTLHSVGVDLEELRIYYD